MNHTNGWTEPVGTPEHAAVERRVTRLSRVDRRERLLETAAGEFACTGLRGTTTAALAERAGISEPVLYIHFENKDRLFKEAVERGIEKRLRLLEAKLAGLSDNTLVDLVKSMAEATVAVCIPDATNAVLTAWALLESPEDAVELHRKEVGSVCLLWERRLAECIPAPRSRGLFYMRVVPYAVQACIAYGFWLAALRHSPATAAPLGHEFAEGIALVAVTQVTAGVQRKGLPCSTNPQ
ncbi:MAG: TetR/AcrR family transcriptional regulator [Bryobacterales bacterium]|nr:TetR/AcrR family transcriptional regulator [Bryobacterales bacterium]